MAQVFPNGFAQPKIAYTDISALGLINEKHYTDYADVYPDMSRDFYIIAAEAQPGVLKHSKHKEYYSWQKREKPLPAFKIAGDASAAAGSTVTVTLTAASHMASGTKSPVAVGETFEDDSTGIVYEVTAVNKTVANAHTATLSVAKSDTIAPVLTAANSYLKYVGRPVQEDSYQQDGIYGGWVSVKRDHTAIRENAKYTDLASFQWIDLGDKTYKMWELPELEKRFLNVQELRLMFGDTLGNIQASTGNQNSGFQGLIPLIQAEGNNVPATGNVFSDTYFEDLTRSISANGYSNDYDTLVDTEALIAFQKYAQTRTGMNGAVIYGNMQDGDVRLKFDFAKQVTAFGNTFSFKNYAFFNSARTHGAEPGTGIWSGSMLHIPRKFQYVGDQAVRSFSISYMSDEPGQVYRLFTDGGLVGKNTNANAEYAYLTWKSLDVANPLEFIWTKLNP